MIQIDKLLVSGVMTSSLGMSPLFSKKKKQRWGITVTNNVPKVMGKHR